MASRATKLSPTAPLYVHLPESGNQIGRTLSTRGYKPATGQWPLVAADLAWIANGAIVAVSFRFHAMLAFLPPTSYPLLGHFCVSATFAVLIVLLCHFQGLYSNHYPIPQLQEVAIIAKSIVIGTVLMGSLLFVSGVKSTSRLVILATAVNALVMMVGWRLFRRWSRGKALPDGLSCHNVLIVGDDSVALALGDYLKRHRHLGFVVLGHLGSVVPASMSEDTEAPSECMVLGDPSELKNLSRKHFADEVIVCTKDRSVVIQAIADAQECGLGVRVVPDLYDGAAFGAQLHYLGDFPTLGVVVRSIPAISMGLKRVLDIAVAGTALLLLGPFLLLIAAIIKLTCAGPALYKSRRIGRKGRPFYCYKFRTMVVDAEQRRTELSHLNERQGVLFKITNDPRITAAGRILRKYSLDELPQLWNVLRGDMSLVGPRPPLLSEVEQYQFEYLRRLEVAPGITGLWQVEARNHPSFDRYISLDLHYVENWSFLLDLHILFRTITVVFAGTGT